MKILGEFILRYVYAPLSTVWLANHSQGDEHPALAASRAPLQPVKSEIEDSLGVTIPLKDMEINSVEDLRRYLGLAEPGNQQEWIKRVAFFYKYLVFTVHLVGGRIEPFIVKDYALHVLKVPEADIFDLYTIHDQKWQALWSDTFPPGFPSSTTSQPPTSGGSGPQIHAAAPPDRPANPTDLTSNGQSQHPERNAETTQAAIQAAERALPQNIRNILSNASIPVEMLHRHLIQQYFQLDHRFNIQVQLNVIVNSHLSYSSVWKTIDRTKIPVMQEPRLHAACYRLRTSAFHNWVRILRLTRDTGVAGMIMSFIVDNALLSIFEVRLSATELFPINHNITISDETRENLISYVLRGFLLTVMSKPMSKFVVQEEVRAILKEVLWEYFKMDTVVERHMGTGWREILLPTSIHALLAEFTNGMYEHHSKPRIDDRVIGMCLRMLRSPRAYFIRTG